MGIRVTLGGIPIALKPGSNFSWALSYGMDPNISNLETTAGTADAILERASYTFAGERTRERGDPVGPLTLVMEDTENNRRVEVKGVYVISGNRPGQDYNTRVLTLADRRWMWDRTLVVRSYNIRRKTGQFRLVKGKLEELVPVQLGRLRADVAYRPFTMLNTIDFSPGLFSAVTKRPWTAKEVLEDVLKELCGEDGYVIDGDLNLTDSIEGLELHEPGPQALSRVLSRVPGAQVYISADGKAHVASLYDGSEHEAFTNFDYGNDGDWSLVNRSLLRPREYNIFSDKEVELRFDAVEERAATADSGVGSEGQTVQRGTGSTATQASDGREPLWCENVIINPLYYLPLDPGGTRIAVQGEPVPLEDFIKAVNLLNFASADASPYGTRGWTPLFTQWRLEKKEIRRCWMGLWHSLRDWMCLDSSKLYNPERLLLLSAIRTHYRQTYRIMPEWRNKIRAISGNRAAVVDWETGTRAPSPVYCQHLTKFSQLGYNPAANGLLATENDPWKDSLGVADLTIGEKPVSPFEVQIIDSDMGLFRVASREDQTGTAESFVIGNVEGELPKMDAKNAIVFWNQVALSKDFKLSTVLTCVQDTPNNEKRMHKQRVSISDAARVLNLPTVPTANGPSMDLIQTSDTARFAWIDGKEQGIREAFYDGKDHPADTMTNPGDIEALALAIAAQELAHSLDRVEGTVTSGMQPIEPTGNLRSVVHFVTVGQGNQAALYTTISAPGEAPGPQIYSLLPEGVRRKVRRLVEQ